MAISKEDALRELFKRNELPAPKRAALIELSKRGEFDLELPQTSEPQAVIEPQAPQAPVLPSSMNQEDFNRIQRTGLTPGTAVDFAGVSIETENARRASKGIPALNPKQAEARLRLFQQQAGTPGSQTRDEFAEIQKLQREDRAGTLAGRVQTAGISTLSAIGEAGLNVAGLVAPEFANRTSEEFQTILNPETESRAGKAGAFAGEAIKTVGLAGKLGTVGLGAAFGAQGAGGVRREVQAARQEGKDISLAEELTTAAAVGGVEAVSGAVTSKVFGALGNTMKASRRSVQNAILKGEQGAIRSLVTQGLKASGLIVAEGGEEAVTQAITNKIRNEGIDAGVAITDGVLESFATGALLAPLGGGGRAASVSAADGPSASVSSDTMLTKLQQGREAAKAKFLEDQTLMRDQREQAAEQEEVRKQTIRSIVKDEGAVDRLLGRQAQPETEQQVETETPAETDSQIIVDAQVDPASVETPRQTIERAAGNRSPDGTMSARAVDVDASREAMNQLLIEKTDVRSWQEAQTIAQEQGIPERAVDIAQSVTLQPRALSDVETAGVVQRLVGVIQDHDDLSQKIVGAEGADLTVLSSELTRLEETHELLTSALRASGTEKGRALNAQKLTLNKNFELVTILAKAKATKGKDLSPKDRDELTTLHRQIKALQARLDRLDSQPESESPTLNKARNQEAEHLRFEKSKLQGKVNRKIEALTPQNPVFKGVKGGANFIKALKSSFDLSAVGRQAVFSVLGNPVRAAKNIAPMLKAMASEKAQFRINEQLKARPNFELYRLAGLRVTDTDQGASLDAKEEIYRSNLANRIPGVRASDRAFTTFLNLMRADSFDAMTASLSRTGKPTMDEAKVVATLVNNFTGFGGLANQKMSTAILNTVFWSPSLQLARFQAATGHAIWKGNKTSKRVRNLVIKEYAKSLTGLATLMMLGLLAGFEIEHDPRSSDFAKLKKGNTRIDISGGIFQYLVLGTRLGTGKLKSPTTGKVKAIRGKKKKFGGTSGTDLLKNFARSKLTPGLGLGVTLVAEGGENVIGRNIITEPEGVAGLLPTMEVQTMEGVKNVVVDAVMPLAINEVVDSLQAEGFTKGSALGLATMLGLGVQNFGNDKK